MAQSLSSKKRIRQNIKQRARNRWRKDQIRAAIKDFDGAIRDGDQTKAAEHLKLCYKKLDQVAAHNTIHKNAAARKKAQLAKRLNAMAE